MSVNSGGKPPEFEFFEDLTSPGNNLLGDKKQKNKGEPSGNKSNISETKARTKFLYSNNELGPFFVIIENTSPEFKGKLNAIRVNDIIYSVHPELDNKIKEIDSIGRNRVRISLKDSKTANYLVNSNHLKPHNLEAYVPKYLVLKQGVISGIDKELSEETLKSKIKQFDSHCNFTVYSVRRITKAIIDPKDQQKKRIDTKSVIVTFKCSILPKYVAIGHVRCQVNTFIQRVVLCYNCFRYGHTKQQCKSNSRCLKCGDSKHKLEECKTEETKCFHCKGEHLPNETRKCLEFSRQKQIKQSMAENNLPYKDAEKSLPKKTYASVLINVSKSQSDVDLQSVDTFSQISRTQKNAPNQTHSTYFTQTKIPTKRNRPTSPDQIFSQHKEILSQFQPHHAGNGILNDPNYRSSLTINPITSPPNNTSLNQNKINLENIVELVISVLNTMKDKQSFEINKSDLKELINSRISTTF